jgi:hypothetical protein
MRLGTGPLYKTLDLKCKHMAGIVDSKVRPYELSLLDRIPGGIELASL